MGKFKSLYTRVYNAWCRRNATSYIEWMRKQGVRIGKGTTIFANPKNVCIDTQKPWLLEIGENVQITRGVTILTHGYDWSVLKGVYGEILGSAGKVTIGNNVFIGMNTTILKGVTIGNNSIIGAGSVVTRDIPDNCVAVGSPAKMMMTLEEYHQKRVAAQYAEASELVRNYREVYGKEPDDKALAEFFWLFCNDDSNLPGLWEGKMRLIGNREETGRVFRDHTPMFKNKDEFLRSIH